MASPCIHLPYTASPERADDRLDVQPHAHRGSLGARAPFRWLLAMLGAVCANASAGGLSTAVCQLPTMNIGFGECVTLVSLYNTTQGDQWTNRSGWGSADVSTWFGVTIIPQQRTVLSINLANNNLSGVLPNNLQQLPNLQTLDVSRNRLPNPLPTSLGSLPALRNLFIDDSQVTGTIPAQLGQLAQLRNLALSGNSLTGAIPASLSQLTLLDTLDLGDNDLSGPIDIAAIPSNARQVLLGGNAFTGPVPAGFGAFTRLELLELGRNQLSGPISPCLANASNLRVLILFDNLIDGKMPAALATLSNLDVLALGQNRLRGSIPQSYAALTLDQFFIDTNQLVAPVYGANQSPAFIPPSLQSWFDAIPVRNHLFQTRPQIIFDDGFNEAGCPS